MAQRTIPKITWSESISFANTLDFGYALDNATSWTQPREGSAFVKSPSGEEDAWITEDDILLAGDARWIPTVATTDPVATGWDGDLGWRGFLEAARCRDRFRFFPDKDLGGFILCHLVEPLTGEPQLEQDGTRRLRLMLRSTDGSQFTGY